MLSYPKREDLDLVALDLDGTVICSKGERPLSPRILKAVKALQEQGLAVTFVTGRTEDYALPYARRFGIEKPLVTYNGCRLYCPVEEKILFQATIETSVAQAIWEKLAPEDVVLVFYTSQNGRLRLLQNRCSGRPDYDDYLFGSPRFIGDPGPTIVEGAPLSKIIALTRSDLDQRLERQFGSHVSAYRTHPELVEILPHGVSKGTGLARLLEHLKLSRERVLSIGDQANDIPSFRHSQFSVAMGDAPEAVKDAADFVTGTFENDGCAMALERLLRQGV